MKLVRLSLTAFIPISFLACHHGENGNNDHLASFAQKDSAAKTIMVKNDSVSLEITYSGEVSFDGDLHGIKSILPKGYVRYKEKQTTVIVTAPPRGPVNYELYDGDKKVAFDDAGQAVLSEATREMAAYGLGAEDRVQFLYDEGGVSAVLKEMGGLKSDYAKDAYFQNLLLKNIPPDGITAIIGKADSIFGSDIAKGNVLKNIAGKDLTSDQFTELLRAAGTIGSDMDKGNVLKALINRNNNTEDQWIRLIEASGAISTEMEKSDLLLSIAKKMPKTEKERTAFMQAMKTLTNDVARNTVEKALNR